MVGGGSEGRSLLFIFSLSSSLVEDFAIYDNGEAMKKISFSVMKVNVDFDDGDLCYFVFLSITYSLQILISVKITKNNKKRQNAP